jgi:uncharacterized protein (DUF885 family)
MSYTPDEVHAIGLAEVQRISARIQHECMRAMGFAEGQQEQFANFMRTEKRFYRDSPEELLEHYNGVLFRINALLPAFFHEQAKCPLEILSRSDGPSAFYMAGTADGKRPGRFYVNVSHCEQRSVCDAVALALHEGVPGHHLQVARCFRSHRVELGPRHHAYAIRLQGDDSCRKPLDSLFPAHHRGSSL